MNRFGRLNSNEEIITFDTSCGDCIPIEGNMPRPTPEHVCDINGRWVIPPVTEETVSADRQCCYAETTDGLMRYILKDILMDEVATSRLLEGTKVGDDTREAIKVFREMVTAIKEENPFPVHTPELLPEITPEVLPELPEEPEVTPEPEVDGEAPQA